MAADKTAEKQRIGRPFEPGVSPNPAGRPKGSRNKLGEAFVAALHDDFQEHGVEAIQRLRSEDAGGYVRVVAGLLPKEFKIETTSDLTDEQLDARIRHLATLVEMGVAEPAGGTKAAEGSQPPGGLPTLQ